METTLVTVIASLGATIALIGGLSIAMTAGVKQAKSVSTEYLPLISVVFSIALSFVAMSFDVQFMGSWQVALFVGLVSGLGASGLYDWKHIVGIK